MVVCGVSLSPISQKCPSLLEAFSCPLSPQIQPERCVRDRGPDVLLLTASFEQILKGDFPAALGLECAAAPTAAHL